ncbi:hypothetical protein SJI00_04165 [Pseudomonas sp. RP23018S]|nr:hypothetical protein [Pseudomonas sp. RP23018S]MDZ5601975.1 hypothetical protein [Pseudomonas sp. RP23018S]
MPVRRDEYRRRAPPPLFQMIFPEGYLLSSQRIG